MSPLNLYIVHGEPTDGSYMFAYVQAVVVAAPSEEAARKIGADEDLLGNAPKFRVQKIGTADAAEPGLVEKFYDRDY